ncbi:unnamed protein product [Bemisia tabaci]|uniref:AAA+ ATPase domain-containing protein n=1 Tax=Bemisia tabaci TaxID=7038 RepID=A0A9P0ABH1_BEMTA|nr:unnamed protein product [Bemisia tabaci]
MDNLFLLFPFKTSSSMNTRDPRKSFLRSNCESFFSSCIAADLADFENAPEVDTFLNDVNCQLLSVTPCEETLKLSLRIPHCEGDDSILVFFKKQPTPVTETNLHQIILMTTIVKSPLIGLHHTLQHVFAPALLEDEKWNNEVDPLLQTQINNLGNTIKHLVLGHCTSNDPESVSDILTVEDEVSFWFALKQSGQSQIPAKKIDAIIPALDSLKQALKNLSLSSLFDVEDLYETIQNSLDDLWKVKYPASRMKHLFDVVGNTLCTLIMKHLTGVDLWSSLVDVTDILSVCIDVCEKFIAVCEQLTMTFWPHYTEQEWSFGRYIPSYVDGFCGRLQEIFTLRTVHWQLSRLLSAQERSQFVQGLSFTPFTGLNALLWSPYSQAWNMAVNEHEKNLGPVKECVAHKLKEQLHSLNVPILQYLQEFKRYEVLIQCDLIADTLRSERENLLEILKRYINEVMSLNFDAESTKSMAMKDVDMPPLIASIYWTRQQEEKVISIESTSHLLLNDLQGFKELEETLEALKKLLKDFQTEKFNAWSRDTVSELANRNIGLSTNEPVVHFEQNKLMKVSYSPELIRFIREVQQLRVLGYHIPDKIQEAADLGKKFKSQAMTLEQVCNETDGCTFFENIILNFNLQQSFLILKINISYAVCATFHNTIGDRMIPSQRPMMLTAAVELARLVQSQNNVTWSDITSVDSYIAKLQAAVQTLALQNDTLVSHHQKLTEKVIFLMDTDLIRELPKWRETVSEMRNIIKEVEAIFINTSSWKSHWNHQLYKALELQYRVGLEHLNHHLPEMKIEVVFRQQKLQFNPSVEEIRAKYYSQLKKFLAIPLNFRGVSDTGLFQIMVERNAPRFLQAFDTAETLFTKLFGVLDDWLEHVALGSVDLEQLVAQSLHVAEDWDNNFKSSKAWGQEMSHLISCDKKFECFTVSCAPVLSEIELHNRRFWDVLTVSLQSSILRDVALVESFISESRLLLEKQPQSLLEIGDANASYVKIMNSSKEMAKLVVEIEKKNNVLSSWTKDRMEQVADLKISWDNFESILSNQQFVLNQQVENMKNHLSTLSENLKSDFEKFALRWEQLRPKEADALDMSGSVLQTNLTILKEKREEWNLLCETLESIRQDYVKFTMDPPDFPAFEMVGSDLKRHEDIWALYEQFATSLEDIGKEDWIVMRNKVVKRMDDFVSSWNEKLTQSQATPLIARLLQEIEKYKAFIPCLRFLRGDMFSEKHWVELFSIIEQPYKPVELIVFNDFLQHKEIVQDRLSLIQELNTRAANEIVLRQAFSELEIWEVEAKFTMMNHVDSAKRNISLIKDFKTVMSKVGDNQCLLQSIKSCPNHEHFLDRASLWETKMYDLDLFLRNLSQIQRKWLYLEPIFGSSSLDVERGRFERVDRDFRFVLSDLIAGGCRVITLTRINNIRNILDTLLSLLNSCQNSLNQFLEKKRSLFPRFYFLSDEDLLEILGQSNKPQVVQLHLKKLFAGIHSVKFNAESTQILSMVSAEGEIVNLLTPVTVTSKIEEWLKKLVEEMQRTLKELIVSCLRSPDPSSYPSQVLCLAESVSFTRQCEDAIAKGTLSTLHSALKNQLEKHTSVKVESHVMELKLKALVMDTIHHLRIISELVEASVSTLKDWKWQNKLRFYLRKDNTVVVKMVDAEFAHSYEYEGNAQKLVHTPLTDRCYLTLTQAIHVGLGGNPYGPAGTGKTESVKALGSLLGRQVLVFNCDEGIDVHSLTRIFVGIVKCGAWGCFDEFNRLEETTLSAISMQIHSIQEALRNSKNKVSLMDQEVDLNPNSGIFVTLNPAGQGYGGRQKLPDNLKELFRPVVMTQPDANLIAQVMLQCHGFKDAFTLGIRIVQIFDAAKNLLSSQKHYDWGLRALKTVISSCCTAYKAARESGVSSTQINEAALVVEALRLNTLSKLTFSDAQKFDLLVKDVFLGVQFQSNCHSALIDEVKNAYVSLGLTYNERQERKCIELYEQLQQRMGVVIVGPPGSGKSTICKILKQALSVLGQTMKQHTFNPKAMARHHLLGHIDLDTRQWTDGIINLTAQTVYSEPETTHSWVICDGDIDPEWIESLNSVLDDNRLLTLPSGWRIQFGSNVNFLFETHDLTHASPATISRMGVILLSEADVDVDCIVTAWLKDKAAEDSALPFLMQQYFQQAVSWIQTSGEMAVKCSLITVVKTFLSQLTDVKTRSHFAVAMVNGLGAVLTLSSRNEFAKQVFTWTSEMVPDMSSAMNCFYSVERDCVETYRVSLDEETPLSSLIPTAQMKTAANVVRSFIQSKDPFILVGASGSAKSTLLKHCVSEMRNVEITSISCSACVTPTVVMQKLSQLCLLVTSNTGRVHRPKNSEHLILHFSDLNLARPDKWGTNILMAFLQQVLTYNGFFEPVNMEWVGLDNVQIVCTLSSCEFLSPRLISLFKILFIGTPSTEELKLICSAYLRNVLQSKEQSVAVSSSMVSVFHQVTEAFNPTLEDYSKFSPHALAHWCKAMKRYPLHDINSILEVFAYEANKLFRDRLLTLKQREKFDEILVSVINDEWSQCLRVIHELKDVFYVCENSSKHTLMQLKSQDWAALVQKSLSQLENDGHDVENILVTPELLNAAAQFERVLTDKKGSLFLPGSSGLGRKTAIKIIASRLTAKIVYPKIGQNYSFSNFRNDMKNVMQQAGIENEQIFLILEDHNLIFPEIMDMINSFLSFGEIPGLFQVDELENLASPLKDSAETVGKSSIELFFENTHNNLHMILILDPLHTDFTSHCAQNPALYKHCTVIWTLDWSLQTMRMMAEDSLSRKMKVEIENETLLENEVTVSAICDEIISVFVKIHEQAQKWTDATLKQYIALVNSYWHLFKSSYKQIISKQRRLQTGVSKLTEARDIVAKLKSEATEQETKLAEKQSKATLALEMITNTMKSANTQKGEMETLKEEFERENAALSERKRAIDAELAEVEPLIKAAQAAVGNIKSESLSEIRSLRAPPDVIRDILEGVLRLMGIQDTSWNSMKSFLAKRGIKEDIRYFDARKINADNRASVEQLLQVRKDSFEAKTALRASAAAAPLATWVTANVKYSQILEKIRPLEREQNKLQQKLILAEEQIGELSMGLDDVDKRVVDLKEQLNTNTKEAVEIEISLNKAKETLAAAEGLVMKLDEEYLRWKEQLSELGLQVETLNVHSLLAAAFIVYLPSCSQDFRQQTVQQWQKMLNVEEFSFVRFMKSECEQSQWVSEGLSSDQLSCENAFIILKLLEMSSELNLTPFVIDPTSMATNWLKKHPTDSSVEVATQSDPRFLTTLELAIRFGKVLIIPEVSNICPILVPILRGNFLFQGSRKLILIGEKVVDFNDKFRLILSCQECTLPPSQKASVISINFSLTKAGLTQQLLSCALKIEKPELEVKHNELLKNAETLKLQLHELQENVLKELANSQGNILNNKELIDSLNNTKRSSEGISISLTKCEQLQSALTQECNAYQALIDAAANLYFALDSLKLMNVFYQMSVATFTSLFEKTLSSTFQEIGSVDRKGKFMAFLHAVYNFMSRCLFKADRLTFALHLVRNVFPQLFLPNEWELLIGQAVGDLKIDTAKVNDVVPQWIDKDRAFDVFILQNTLPNLYSTLRLEEEALWREFMTKGDVIKVPPHCTDISVRRPILVNCPSIKTR